MVSQEDNSFIKQIKLWKRYIDDVLLIWTGTANQSLTFAKWHNSLNPYLKFTMMIGGDKLPFLDLLIYEKKGTLATEVYYKPTDRNNLLHFQSFHPTRENLPVRQFLHRRYNCSDDMDYTKHAGRQTFKETPGEKLPGSSCQESRQESMQ
ncbi:hypothetical protein NDU88_005443 [Pleurodeles waltl]|uniref:Uncharacterized protein n=1 Tax=Pleurodeles waltl TaxID=8319 RepID=A0AAV7MA05_PLEWA|nr:hypothetical protein NDU88_005443 [Pleurodeles waltl]